MFVCLDLAEYIDRILYRLPITFGGLFVALLLRGDHR
jgi:hypothetical protein